MTLPPHDPAPGEQATQAAAIRDAAVRRVRSATRWLAAGALALTGAIAGVVADQHVPAKAATGGNSASSGTAQSQSQEQGASGGESGSASGYEDGSGSTGEDSYGYDDGGQYSGAPQAPQQAPQSAPQSAAPSASSGAS